MALAKTKKKKAPAFVERTMPKCWDCDSMPKGSYWCRTCHRLANGIDFINIVYEDAKPDTHCYVCGQLTDIPSPRPLSRIDEVFGPRTRSQYRWIRQRADEAYLDEIFCSEACIEKVYLYGCGWRHFRNWWHPPLRHCGSFWHPPMTPCSQCRGKGTRLYNRGRKSGLCGGCKGSGLPRGWFSGPSWDAG